MTALAAIWGALGRIPREAWLIAAALAAIALYGHHREGQGRHEGRAEMQAKIDAAERARYAALASEEQALRTLAKRTDSNVAKEREANRDTTEQFIRSGGLRQARASGDNAPRGSAGSGAPVHQTPVMDATQPVQVVGVTAEDVRICTDNTLAAEALREFVLGLEG